MDKDILELANFEGLPMALAGNGAIHSNTSSLDSSPRLYMLYNQKSQSTVFKSPMRRRFSPGTDVEFGKYADTIKFNRDSRILATIPKYRSHKGYNSLNVDGTISLIVETDKVLPDCSDYELDLITLEPHRCHDVTFGYEMVAQRNILSRLNRGARFEKDTVIYRSPNFDEYGNYNTSVEAMMAYIDMPWTIEDGFGVRRKWLNRLTMKGYGTRQGVCGKNYFPLNLYGDENTYKILPDYGEKVRKDGLLMAFRLYDPLLNGATMTPKSVRHVDREYDILVYAKAGAVITDITIIESSVSNGEFIPEGMDEQLKRYSDAQRSADKEFHDFCLTLNEKAMSHKLHNAFVNKKPRIGETVYNNGKPRNVKLDRKRQVLPQWDIKVQFSYDIVPSIGFKLTDFHGGKGVICYIYDDEDAPRDTLGNLVDVTQSPSSPPKRQNLGCIYEPFVNAAGDTCVRNLKIMLDRGDSIQQMWDYYIGFVSIVDVESAEITNELRPTDGDKIAHLHWEIQNGIHIDSGTGNTQLGLGMLRELRKHYCPHFEPLWVRRHNSNTEDDPWVQTDQPIMIGMKSIFPLEKIGSDASACADVKLTHHGIPARITQRDKYGTPRRDDAKRTGGESEVRHRNNAQNNDAGESVIADHLDIAANPKATDAQYRSILTADEPSKIERCVNRNLIPIGDGRPRAMVRDFYNCAGIYLTNELDPEDRAHEEEAILAELKAASNNTN